MTDKKLTVEVAPGAFDNLDVDSMVKQISPLKPVPRALKFVYLATAFHLTLESLQDQPHTDAGLYSLFSPNLLVPAVVYDSRVEPQ